MGWNTGNDVFDPVARDILNHVEDGAIPPFVATGILANLIRGLQDCDWDTENESLDKFKDKPIVVEAFRQCEIELDS